MSIIIYFANLNDLLEKERYVTEKILKTDYSDLNSIKKYIDNKYNSKIDIILSNDKIISELSNETDELLFIETKKNKKKSNVNVDNIFNNLINNILENVNNNQIQEDSLENNIVEYNEDPLNQIIEDVEDEEFEFRDKLLELNNIGFNNNNLNQEALIVSNGNINSAINYIIENN